jgi:L-asparaginase/Glu-tRNA(Gln) amidotransferase subunit D
MAPRPDGSGIAYTPSVDDPVAAVPQLKDIAEISPRALTSIPGANVTLHDLFSIAEEIVAEIDAGRSRVLIVQASTSLF